MGIVRAGFERTRGGRPNARLVIHQAEVRERAEILHASRWRGIGAGLGIHAGITHFERDDQEAFTLFQCLCIGIEIGNIGRELCRSDGEIGIDRGEAVIHRHSLTNSARHHVRFRGAEVEGAFGKLGRTRVHARWIELLRGAACSEEQAQHAEEREGRERRARTGVAVIEHDSFPGM